ncbi:MAG TPA: glycoside hydrolase domain-containing protein [Aeromicrobium sp.]|nr:glycoside hydrolase domain-containing protein [Aeromicrobium sp.]
MSSPTRAVGIALATAALVIGVASPAPAAPAPQAPGTYRGLGFDTCVAPDQATMDAWRAKSPFRAVGIYVSGNSRYCGDAYQPNLSPGWVRTNAARGWRFIPIHVGYQSPCFRNNPNSRVQKKHMSRNIRTARQQAASDAVETIRAMYRLGFGRGSVSYLDIEWYKRTRECDNAVLEFIDQWTETLRRYGYRSGVYSSGSAAIKAMDEAHAGRRAGFTAPDHIWFAWTNKKADTDGGPYLNDAFWQKRRIHQYHNGNRVTFGGKTLTIDWNALDVSGTSQPTRPAERRCPAVARAAAGSTPFLERGSEGSAVRRVQRALALTGRSVPVTGYYGRITEGATWSYRKANGLGSSKKVASQMWAALQRGACR